MKLEKDLNKQIEQRLSIYTLTGECEWWGRLNSLHVLTIMGSYVKGCPKGTPDFIAIIRTPIHTISVLFIEAKSDSGKLRKEQTDFLFKYNRKFGFTCIVVRNIKELDDWINTNAINRVAEISL